MSRAQALRMMGVGAAGMAVAGFGLGGAVRAAQLAPPGNDPLGLLDGAETIVPAVFNPALGEIKSAVTAVMFHSNVETGAINVDGSKKYIPSYANGGLVDAPVYVEKEMNGVRYKQYSGELSGYGWSNGTTGPFQYLYGPIGEGSRSGLKGVNFVLYIPENWNGVLIQSNHGGFTVFGAHLYNAVDEFLLLSRGFAYVAFDAAGRNSPTDTNVNNDEYWLESLKLIGIPSNQKSATNPPNYYLASEVSFNRDAIRVMKNILKNHFKSQGREVEKTYLITRSASGSLPFSLTTGRYLGNLYNGGNYERPYINSPLHPENQNDSNKTFSEPMIYDGFHNFSASAYIIISQGALNPAIPISKAPLLTFDSASDGYQGQLSNVVLARMAHEAKYTGAYSAYWPDIKSTLYMYNLENHPHFNREWAYATAMNGTGMYALITNDPTYPISYNTEGIGYEVNWHVARKVLVAEANGIDYHKRRFGTDAGAFTFVLFFHEKGVRVAGAAHQHLTNLDEFVRGGMPMPTSIIDPYWIEGGKIWPKLAYLGTSPYPQNTAGNAYGLYGQSDLHLGNKLLPPTQPSMIDISTDSNGKPYYNAVNYLTNNDVMSYEARVVRAPDDAARLGLYIAIYSGMIQPMYRPFTEAELITGLSGKDWNGGELLTTTTHGGNRAIPLDGYNNHGGYVSAMSQAVNALVQGRLFDPEIGALLVVAAAQSEYPVIERRNLGQALKELSESMSPEDLEKLKGL